MLRLCGNRQYNVIPTSRILQLTHWASAVIPPSWYHGLHSCRAVCDASDRAQGASKNLIESGTSGGDKTAKAGDTVGFFSPATELYDGEASAFR
jgi:hypothetical protein